MGSLTTKLAIACSSQANSGRACSRFGSHGSRTGRLSRPSRPQLPPEEPRDLDHERTILRFRESFVQRGPPVAIDHEELRTGEVLPAEARVGSDAAAPRLV